MTRDHEMQHADGPTWCVHCGTFDVYCRPGGCDAEPTGRYDTRTEAGRDLVTLIMLGRPTDPTEAREKWTGRNSGV